MIDDRTRRTQDATPLPGASQPPLPAREHTREAMRSGGERLRGYGSSSDASSSGVMKRIDEVDDFGLIE
jgi:hypothetical protein